MPDYDLKLAVAKIKTKRLNFALYKGAKDNQVLITPQPPKPKLIAAMEEEIGEAKRIAKGVCFWDKDELIFATKNTPAPAWETITTKIFKANECAKFLPVIFRQLAENESEEANEAEGEEDAPAAATATPLAVDEMGKFKARLTALMPAISAALAAAAPAGQDAKLKVSEAAVFARKQDFPAAHALLDEADALLKKGNPAKDEWDARFAELEPKYLAALQGNPPDAAKMRVIMTYATEQAEGGNHEKAVAAIQRLGPFLGAAPKAETPAAPVAKAAKPEPLIPIWQDAKETVDNRLSAIQLAMRHYGDQDLNAIADELTQALTGFRATLNIALMDYDKATDDTRPQLAQRALKVVQSYQQRIVSDPLILAADDNPFDIKMDLQGTLGGALNKLTAALQA